MYSIGHTISANAPFLFWNNDVIALPQEKPTASGRCCQCTHKIVCFIFSAGDKRNFSDLFLNVLAEITQNHFEAFKSGI